MVTKTQATLSGLIVTALCVLFYYNRSDLRGIYSHTTLKAVNNYFFQIDIKSSATFNKTHSSCTKKFQISQHATEYNWTEVISSCELFQDRVSDFNKALDQLRNKTLVRIKDLKYNGPKAGTTVEVIWGANDDYLQRLGKNPDLQTVVLPWLSTKSEIYNSLTDKSNLLLQNYYEWTANEELCAWIEAKGLLNMKYDMVFNRTCNRYYNKTIRPQSLKPIFLNVKPIHHTLYYPNKGSHLPPHFFTNTTPYVFYLHIIPDAVVTDSGDIYTKSAKIVPYGCSADRNPKVPEGVERLHLYDEIFVITQYWGSSMFHRMAEIIPRLASSMDFLKRNPQIKILAPEKQGGRLGELLIILGLDPRRLVNEWSRARIAYVPRASYCGTPSIQESQIISSMYRNHVVKILGALPRNKLILIRRSGSRRLTEQRMIEEILKRLAREYGLEYEMFIDNPAPSLPNTMRMFHAAVMVVAPHGAGLANLFFSQPGTYVIEGVCNRPHVNFCFQRLSVILGHHWHGIPSRGGCEGVVDIAANDVEFTAKTYLEHFKLLQKSTT